MDWHRSFLSVSRWFVTLVFVTILNPLCAAPPPIMLSTLYQDGVVVNDCWVSEKLDGVRAYWNGKDLVSRQGTIYRAPAWFIEGLPQLALDGELWLGRNRFDELSGIVRRQTPEQGSWRDVKFMVFDMPQLDVAFTQRLTRLEVLVSRLNMPWVQSVKQQRVAGHAALQSLLDRVVAKGGEGLMLHHQNARYRSGRSHDLLKLKPYQDAEARVVAHIPGRGKYQGVMGSLLVESQGGKQFRVGTGFSVAERNNPPPIGAWITYKYHGLIRNGLPRFASYIRVRSAVSSLP